MTLDLQKIRGRGTALVLGGGYSLWDDLDDLEALMGGPWPGAVLVVNDVGCKRGEDGRLWEGPVHHWCTLHAEQFSERKRQRQKLGLSMNFLSWSSVRRTVMDYHFMGWTNGSSGLYAISVAFLALHHPRVVGCGIPMNGQKNLFSGREWKTYQRYVRGWKTENAFLQGRLKSFSGWTRETFGPPTLDWIGLVPAIED